MLSKLGDDIWINCHYDEVLSPRKMTPNSTLCHCDRNTTCHYYCHGIPKQSLQMHDLIGITSIISIHVHVIWSVVISSGLWFYQIPHHYHMTMCITLLYICIHVHVLHVLCNTHFTKPHTPTSVVWVVVKRVWQTYRYYYCVLHPCRMTSIHISVPSVVNYRKLLHIDVWWYYLNQNLCHHRRFHGQFSFTEKTGSLGVIMCKKTWKRHPARTLTVLREIILTSSTWFIFVFDCREWDGVFIIFIIQVSL